jgi:hypothetical protein
MTSLNKSDDSACRKEFSLIFLVISSAVVIWRPFEQLDIRAEVNMFETVCGLPTVALAYRNMSSS